jgi:hypothetical protein
MVQHILDVAGLEGFVVERELLIVDSGETAGIELKGWRKSATSQMVGDMPICC